MKNAKIQKFICDIFSDFQTLCSEYIAAYILKFDLNFQVGS